MNKQTALSLISDLSNARGAPGFEEEVLAVIRRYGEGLGEWTEDSMRNLYLHRTGWKENKPVLMLDAHTDEVGFMVRAIRPNGTLDFVTLGGWVASSVSAHRVMVKTKLGDWVSGVIASKPPHFLSEAERKLAPDISQMVIDIGAKSNKEVIEDYQISMAAPIVPDVSLEYCQRRDIMIGKAFDDRLGCAVILSTLRELESIDLPFNIICAFSSQEEMGLRGARVTAQVINPKLSIAFEGCPADDTVLEPYLVQTALKKGPMLRHIDSSMITNPRFQRFALDIAREKAIPVQEAVRTGGSTDGGVIHTTFMAVPTIVIGVPVRYIHSHHGIASYSDYEDSVRLASELIRSLDEKTIAGF